MKWIFKEGIPIYQQIVQFLRTGIANGTYPPGSKVPAVRDFALEAGVNPNTMQRALTELERDGLMYSVRTSGRFITEDGEKLEELKNMLSGEYIDEMLLQLRGLGYTDEEILEAVRLALAQENEERNEVANESI